MSAARGSSGCVAWVLGLWLGIGAANAGDPAEIAAKAVLADVARAAGLFEAGHHPEALAALDALAARLAPERLRAHPLIMVMRGQALAALGRCVEALDAFDRALAWSSEGTSAHAHAARHRRALLESDFGRLAVRCARGVVRVVLVEQGEERACPAVWSPLPAGRWTVRGVGAEVERTVTLAGGGEVVVEVAAPKPPPAAPLSGRWSMGALAGAGLSTIGASWAMSAVEPGATVRVAAQLERRWLGGRLAVASELGLTQSTMRYLLVDAPDELLGALRWRAVEGAFVGRGCGDLTSLQLCVTPGVMLGWLVSSRYTTATGSSGHAEHGTGALHLGLRGGLDVRWALDGWAPSLGAHAAWSPWPGAIGFSDGSAPYLRGWLDAGVWF